MAKGNEGALKNPGCFEISSGLRTALIVLTVIGVATMAGALATNPGRAWASFVQNHFFFMSLALGGLFWSAIQWLTSAMWSAPVRRLSESFTAYLPIALATTILLAFGIHYLYVWSDARQIANDMIIRHKSGYMNPGFFMIRSLIAIALWLFFAYKLIGRSLAQDRDPNFVYTSKNRGLSAVFMIIFALSYTIVSFDQIMSLDARWYSTIFGVYCFAGLFYSTLALHTLITLYLLKKGKLQGIVNENHLHDLGKFMFAFTVFWAYIGFAQFMLIWYANMPDETGYFLHRFAGGWLWVSIFLLVGKFMVPFFLLLPRDAKRNQKMLAGVAIFMLFSQWIDVLWMVQPEFFKYAPEIGWVEIGIPLGFIGVFGLAVSRFLARNNVVAIGDPRLAQSVYHHRQ